MNGKLKLLLGGLALGILVIFALVGVKSMFADKQPAPNSQLGSNGWEPSYEPSIIGLPGNKTENETGDKTASLADTGETSETPGADTTVSQQDAAATGEDEKLDVELVGEPGDKEKPTTQAQEGEETPSWLTDTDTEPQQPESLQTPQEEPATIASLPDEPTIVEPPQQQTPAAGTGKLEIVLQAAENGKPLKANVYIQKTNGVNVDKSAYTNKATFNLKPGTYRVTARTKGRGTLTRDITVPVGAVVNEIFPLPSTTASAPATPAPAPMTQAPPQPEPQAPAQGTGKLRLVALAADDGSPIPVNFAITRLNGSVIDSARNVPVAEFALPAEEYIARFEYQGAEGYKSVTVQSGQTHTHTFNIRGLPSAPAQSGIPLDPQMQQMEMPQMPQQQPQNQNIEDVMMQRLQEELHKLTN